MKDRTRSALLARVAHQLGRELATRTVLLHSAIASSAGLSATDTRCLEWIARTERDDVTPGELTKATGLTTGAITGVIDRLESAGLVQRVRDTQDRRKVFLRLTPSESAGARLMSGYQRLGQAMESVAARRSTDELAAIDRFLTDTLAAMDSVLNDIRNEDATPTRP